MKFNEYQDLANRTVVYPQGVALPYLALGLSSEAGEVCGKLKKVLRGDYPIDEIKDALSDELGDVLWYVASMASELGIDLDDIALSNVSKLSDRMERGVVAGSGDNR